MKQSRHLLAKAHGSKYYVHVCTGAASLVLESCVDARQDTSEAAQHHKRRQTHTVECPALDGGHGVGSPKLSDSTCGTTA